MAAATAPKPWRRADDSDVVVVEDVKELKQAVHDEMEAIGCGYYQRRVVTILGFGNVADAVEILAIGYILTVYEDTEGKISPWESSFLTAAVFAGMLAGGFTGGVLGDIYGRKPVLLTTLAINALAAFLSAFSTSIYWLIFFRTVAGLGVGGVVSSLFALCLEHVPVSARGRYVTILCSFWMVGSVLTAGTAWLMLGNDVHGRRILDISWRWFAAVVGLPSFGCLLFTAWYIPESAHFLASQGKAQAVSEVLQFIHAVNGSARQPRFQFVDPDVDVSLQKAKLHGAASQPPSGRGSVARAVFDADRMRGLGRLFQSPYWVGTTLLMFCAFCLSFGSYGLSTWITKLFQSVGLSNPFANAFLFAGANLPGNLVSLYLVDLVGRKQLLSGAFFSSALCALLFAFNVEGSATVVVLVSCLFNACTTAAWNAFGVLSAENFPLEVRTTGISLVNCSGRIGAITAQFVNGFLMGDPPHVAALLLVASTVMVSGGLAARQVKPPEESDPAAVQQRRASLQLQRAEGERHREQELARRTVASECGALEEGDDDDAWSETQSCLSSGSERSA
ncbi:hypothetical protein P43SY_001989 [Pythium insidiosum]|uniref:Major facilitator superfamily (MFS) profile domain-containing protein n=1 Tax=Pythium insidiosum TaxID=114742 RepID=A0AAD5QB54_PYTIN|nr:hypothetical protein P43SY_001989 [Pythium insidiosum]